MLPSGACSSLLFDVLAVRRRSIAEEISFARYRAVQ